MVETSSVIFTAGLAPVEPKCFTTDILDDSLLEGDHDFSVTITDITGSAVLDTRSSSTTVIIDDDEGNK